MSKKEYRLKCALKTACKVLNDYANAFNPVMRNNAKIELQKYLTDEDIENILRGELKPY